MSLPLTGAGPSSPNAGGAPTGTPSLSVSTDLGSTDASLSWTAVSRATSYSLWRGTNATPDPDTDPELATGITGTTYTDSIPAAAGETYTYIVRAINGTGEGPSSNAASVVLPGECEAPVLTGPSPTTQPGAYPLTWTVPAGATFDRYRIYRAADEAGPYTLEDTIEAEPSPAYTAGLTGWWQVAAYNSLTTTEGPLSNAVYGEIVIPGAWILATGFWNDEGAWDDDAFWKDYP